MYYNIHLYICIAFILYINHIIFLHAYPQNHIRILLFVKKDDAEGTDFYYLGKMNYNSFEDTTMKSGESVVKIRFEMETPVPQNPFNYLEGA